MRTLTNSQTNTTNTDLEKNSDLKAAGVMGDSVTSLAESAESALSELKQSTVIETVLEENSPKSSVLVEASSNEATQNLKPS